MAANTDRRSLLNAGAVLAGAAAVAAPAQAQDAPASNWSPTLDALDDWMDKPGTRHRVIYDTTGASAARKGAHFANNFYVANKSAYGIPESELAVILVLRAESTPFGYGDAVWKRYGKTFAKLMKFDSDQTNEAERGNPLLSGGDNEMAPSLALLAAKGARFAVCGMATHGISGMLAKEAGEDAADVEAFIKANLVPGAVVVPAGVVGVSRAQERGYTFTYVAD